jgi:hypothetical protein
LRATSGPILGSNWGIRKSVGGRAGADRRADICSGEVMLLRRKPDPTAGRQRRIMRTIVGLVILITVSYVLGLIYWPELMPWSR